MRAEFDRLSPLIAEALAYGGNTHTLEDVWLAINRGKAQFWPGPGSVLITEIKAAPRCKSLHVWLAAGTLQEIEAMSHPLYEWGKDMGCKRIAFSGRRGWERTFLRADGWEPRYIVMERSL